MNDSFIRYMIEYLSALQKIGLISKAIDWTYEHILRRRRISETARSFITEIKLIEANEMVANLALFRLDTNTHQEVIGPEEERIFEVLEQLGVEEKEIERIRHRMQIDILKAGLPKIDERYFPDDVYKGNVDKLGELNRDQADAVSEFYSTLKKMKSTFEDIETFVDDRFEDKSGGILSTLKNGNDRQYNVRDYRRLEQELKSATGLAEELARQRAETLRILGADEDEFVDALSLHEIENTD